MKAIAAFALLLCLTASGALAQEWPTLGHDAQRTGYSISSAPETDQIAWTFNGAGSFSSPTVAGDKVFIGSEDGYIRAINVINGKEVWNFKAGDEVASPTFADGRIYTGSLGIFYCLDAVSGENLWSCPTNGAIHPAPAVIGNFVYVTSTDNYVYAINATTGQLLWGNKLGNKINPSPAVANDIVFVSTWNGRMYALHTSDGFEVWHCQVVEQGVLENYPIISSPSIAGGRVYVGSNDGHLYVLDVATCENLWEFEAGDQIEFSPAVADNVVYFGSSDGHVYALNARDNVGDRGLWSYSTGDRVQSSPAVADNKVFITSQNGYLYALNALDGTLIWRHYIGVGRASPAVAYGKVFIGTSDGKLYCFGSWGSVLGGDIWKGVIYLFVTALLMLALWWLVHLKPSAPKKRGRTSKKIKKK